MLPDTKKKKKFETFEKFIMDASKWLTDRNLKLSDSKSQILIFEKSRKRQAHINQVQRLTNIPIVKETKFLGLLFDKNLKWKKHFQHIKNKGSQIINILKSITASSYGSHPSTMILFIKNYLYPSIEYGLFTIPNLNESHENQIDVIYRKAGRIALGMMNSTSNVKFYSESKLTNYSTRRSMLAAKFLLKTKSMPSHPFNKILTDHLTLQKVKRNLSNWTSLLYNYAKEYNLTHQYRIPSLFKLPCPTEPFTSLHYPNFTSMVEFRDMWPDYLFVFTDGSKSEQNVGSAVYVREKNLTLQYKLHPSLSIYYAEAFAIMKALGMSLLLKENKILILTDSRSVLKSLSRNYKELWKTQPIIIDILDLIYLNQKMGKSIIFTHLKAHANIHEVQDILAKQTNLLPSITQTKFSPQETSILVLKDLRDKWNQQLQAGINSSQSTYKDYVTQTHTHPWYNKILLPRKYLTTIIRARVSHYKLNSHLYRLKLIPSPLCTCGNGIQTLNHILTECDTLRPLVNKLYDTLYKTKLPKPISVYNLLFSPTKKFVILFYRFTQQSKLSL
jgi:ribonuclease HI